MSQPKRVLNLQRSLSTNHIKKYRHMELAAGHVILPPKVDLAPLQSQVWDQGQSGSCSAYSSKSALEELQLMGLRAKTPPSKDPLEWSKSQFTPISAFFHYWNTRAIEGSTDTDGGASNLVDVATALETKGACSEATWSSEIGNLLVEPSKQAYDEAVNHKLPHHYLLDQNLTEMKRCLHNGFGFVFGVLVYDSFMDAQNGMIPMPNVNSENLDGGHALYMVGYDDHIGCLKFKNSWGASWGDNGYGYIPYGYILDPNLSFDQLTLRLAATSAP